jgi:hypothetical protein
MSNTTFDEELVSNSRRCSEGKRPPSKNEFLNFLDKSYDAKHKGLLSKNKPENL